MSLHYEKMVLTGGKFSERTIDAAFEIRGMSNPSLLIDTSPKVKPEAYYKSRKTLSKWFDNYGKVKPEWLNAEQPGAERNELQDKLEAADVLMVTGGSTMRAMERWKAAGIDEIIRHRVRFGSLAIHGASAGAMIWFQQGYSDSMQYETPNKWDYIVTPGMGVVPAWVTAHHDEIDEFGRERWEGFRTTLAEHYGEWETAIGLESHSALMCVNGMAKVLDVRGDGRASYDTYMYTPVHNNLPQQEVISTGSLLSDDWLSLSQA